MRIGVVGYSAQKFDVYTAAKFISQVFDIIGMKSIPKVVSGLTDMGIPRLAYREAISRDWKTVGIACSKAYNYDCYPVDKEIIVGDNWGDESQMFIDYIDVLVRIGGGKQSLKEVEMAKAAGKPVIEYELEAI